MRDLRRESESIESEREILRERERALCYWPDEGEEEKEREKKRKKKEGKYIGEGRDILEVLCGG